MNKIIGVMFFLAIGLGLGGCVSQEGIGFANDPYINKGMTKYAAIPSGAVVAESDSDDEQERSTVESVIAIGRTSALRRFDEQSADKAYDKYRKAFAGWGLENEPNLTREKFVADIAGWTRLKVMNGFIMAAYVKALVPNSIVDSMNFQDSASTILLQLSSDLVAARTNVDGALEIVKLLCEDELGATKCDKQYRKGIYDAASGQQMDSKMVLKKDADRIDPETFHRID